MASKGPLSTQHDPRSSPSSSSVIAAISIFSSAYARRESRLARFIISFRSFGRKEMVVAGICGAVALIYAYFGSFAKERRTERDGICGEDISEYGGVAVVDADVCSSSRASASSDTIAADPSLLKKHSRIITISTEQYTYPGVRIFYRAHSKASVLPPNLPLVVLIHGLGGQLEQFQYLIEYYVNICHVLAIDLPGCGESAYSVSDWNAYTTPALCSVVANVVQQFREKDQKVVLIGHSMGCALGVKLITKGGLLEDVCVGFVAVCPKATITEHERKRLSNFLLLPEFAFDIFRTLDRRGGLNSQSVKRMVGSNATNEAKALQFLYNKESRTPVWRRMCRGARFPTRDDWIAIRHPILLVAASEDKVTPPGQVDVIHSWFDNAKKTEYLSSDTDNSSDTIDPPHPGLLKKCLIPNAGHGVMYESPHILCGLVSEFLAKHISEILSYAWQLSYLKEDKWILKNLKKWEKIESVSPRIVKKSSGGQKSILTPFRPMKTLRQNDVNGHNPVDFSQKWTDVRDVIDISHEQPRYEPETFGAGVRYHKFATVSKIPPTREEVAGFISLVDKIRKERGYDENLVIACHCHYGFNRTGFLVTSYLIERLGFTVAEAIEAFKESRPPGIRHPHFITELYERYCLGLTREATF